jgi:hypothetical protein
MFVTLGLMAALGPRPPAFAVRMAIITVMLAVVLYSGFVVLAEIDAIQQAAGGPIPNLDIKDLRRIRFDELHLLSERLMLADMAGALLLLFWEAKHE